MLARAPLGIELVGTGFNHPVPPGNWRDVVLDATAPARVADVVSRERPGAVIYASYRMGDRAITVDGARYAARAAAKAGARFVYISSDMVLGGETGNYDERAPAVPKLLYGEHNLEAEGNVWIEHEEAVILRPALMVGETARQQRPAYECETLSRGLPCRLYVDEWRTPVHVDDVARAAWDLASMDVRGVYHLGGPVRLSRLELGRVLCAMFGFDAALCVEARRPADRPRDLSLNSARLAGLLGWQARRIETLGPRAQLAAAL